MFVSHTVHIDAPPAKVWDVLADVERWPEFAPQFKSIVRKEEGPLAMGSSARVTPHGFFGSVWTVTQLEPGRSFAWESGMLPGVHLLGDHVIEPEGDSSSVTFSLRSSGPLAGLLGLALGRIFRRNTRQAAEGLKAFCEGARS